VIPYRSSEDFGLEREVFEFSFLAQKLKMRAIFPHFHVDNNFRLPHLVDAKNKPIPSIINEDHRSLATPVSKEVR
jgi:hypothetical protein